MRMRSMGLNIMMEDRRRLFMWDMDIWHASMRFECAFQRWRLYQMMSDFYEYIKLHEC